MIRARTATVLPLLFVMMALPFVLHSSVANAATAFTEVKKLTQGSPTSGGATWFGYDVAVDGDTAIGIAREPWNTSGSQGSASIFERDLGGTNNWGERVKLTFPGLGDIGSVAIDGDTVVVGRDFENLRDGAAYVFGRNVGGPDNWGLVTRIADADGMQGCCDGFGTSVAISGDTIAVGEIWANRVHIFERNEGGTDNWGRVKVFTADPPGTYDFFFQVSIEGDTLVVGSAGRGLAAAGAVYVFDRNTGGSNNWGLVKEIFASDAAAGDHFGMTTALSGDTLIAGTSGNNNNAAYVFERNEGGPNNWGEVQKLVGSDVLASEKAVAGVGISGDVAVLTHGSHVHLDSLGDPQTYGTAFVFERDEGGPNNWGETQELLPSDVWNYPSLSVDIDCGTIIVGDQNDYPIGAAYIFEDPAAPTSCGGANVPPVAEDDSATTGVDTPVIVNVVNNDTDEDDTVLTATNVTGGTNGSTVASGGDVTYTPNPGFVGVDTFTYTANDGDDDSNEATVTVIVTDDCDCAKSVGFWKKQFSGKGNKNQIDDDTLGAYLSIVALSSGVFGDINLADAKDVFNPPKSNNRGGSGSHNGSGSGSNEASGPSSTGRSRNSGGSRGSSGGGTKLAKQEQNAQKQLLAAWLNYAKGAVDSDVLILEVEGLMEAGDFEAAKELAESINLQDKDNPDCDTKSGTGSGSNSRTRGSDTRSRGGRNR